MLGEHPADRLDTPAQTPTRLGHPGGSAPPVSRIRRPTAAPVRRRCPQRRARAPECAVRPRHSTKPSKATMTEQPTKPSSSPATVKMKSVCCSGTKPPLVWAPWPSPTPSSPPRRHGDLGLGGAVTETARIYARIQKGGEPLQLVALEQVQLHRAT